LIHQSISQPDERLAMKSIGNIGRVFAIA